MAFLFFPLSCLVLLSFVFVAGRSNIQVNNKSKLKQTSLKSFKAKPKKSETMLKSCPLAKSWEMKFLFCYAPCVAIISNLKILCKALFIMFVISF